jgi:hypothetical protein
MNPGLLGVAIYSQKLQPTDDATLNSDLPGHGFQLQLVAADRGR